MPKWASPVFSDIRNAMGENVVFSQWKGRPYMRSWVKPANPQTSRQMAHRAVLKELVKRFQSLKSDPDVLAEWNIEALPYVVSGFNIFTKWGRLSKISVEPSSGSAPLDVTITYTCGIPLSKATLLQIKGATVTKVLDVGQVEAGENKTKQIEDLTSGTYYFFLACDSVLKSGDTSPQAYQGITKWAPDIINGVAKEAKVVVT